MTRLKAFLLTGALLLTAHRAPAAIVPDAGGIREIRLNSGDAISGTFDIESNGIFHWREDGGKLYRWRLIQPESLPKSVRESVRGRALSLLNRAATHYRAANIEVTYGADVQTI